MNQNSKTPNHLIHEKSPYLLQHAYNPVDWYPWSEEAFRRAKEEKKPIFLSIGYSTCHWCHVMERESFEDKKVAEVLNQHFISIKVDKEERPDVDSIYMTFCMAIHGHGGWPLTILMTPEQKPFYAGTYLPKLSNGQMIGLLDLLSEVNKIWTSDRKRLLESGEEVTKALETHIQSKEKGKVTSSTMGVAYHNFLSSFDATYGGFGNAPKFPTPHNLLFLLRYARLFKESKALDMVNTTLMAMYQGGIYDHIGGGFSRYSTDRKWLVPHFEKMLYDNAMLVLAYSEAYQYTKEPIYKAIVEKVLQYVKRELTQEDGGFYCAQDADSEGEEGKYYVFTPEEVIEVLGEEVGQLFNDFYDITTKGNFEGKNIPNQIGQQKRNCSDELTIRLKEAKERLYAYRLHRTKLHKDDKVLTSWNALMIAACAKAYQVFLDTEYLLMAKRGLEFVCNHLMDPTGRLYVRYRDHESFGSGHVDDYAFLCFACYELYEATFDPSYLEKSLQLMDSLIEHFWDSEGYGFYLYADDAEQLILRPKETYDGAIPSGNSVASYLLCKLERITGDQRLRDYSEKQLSFLAGECEEYPAGFSFALLSYLEKFRPTKELVCLLQKQEQMVQVMDKISTSYHPNMTVIIKTPENKEQLENMATYLKDYKDKKHDMTFYLCENQACLEPFHELSQLEECLRKE